MNKQFYIGDVACMRYHNDYLYFTIVKERSNGYLGFSCVFNIINLRERNAYDSITKL